jgi:hypothetical protein
MTGVMAQNRLKRRRLIGRSGRWSLSRLDLRRFVRGPAPVSKTGVAVARVGVIDRRSQGCRCARRCDRPKPAN